MCQDLEVQRTETMEQVDVNITVRCTLVIGDDYMNYKYLRCYAAGFVLDSCILKYDYSILD